MRSYIVIRARGSIDSPSFAAGGTAGPEPQEELPTPETGEPGGATQGEAHHR